MAGRSTRLRGAASLAVVVFAVVAGLAACGPAREPTAAPATSSPAPTTTTSTTVPPTTTTLPPEPEPVVVAVLGSSTAYGMGAQPNQGWVSRYAAFLRAEHEDNEVINLGYIAYSSYQMLPTGTAVPLDRPGPDPERNITAAIALRPDAIILNLSSYDTFYGFGAAEQLANADAIVAAADAADVPIWVTTPQPRTLDAAGIAANTEVRDTVLERYGERAIDFWTGLASPGGTVEPSVDDGSGFDPNDAGHQLLFERVRDADLPGALAAG